MTFFVLYFFLFCYCCHFPNISCWYPGEVDILRSNVSPWYRFTFPSLSIVSSLDDLPSLLWVHLLSFPFYFIPVLNLLWRWLIFLFKIRFIFPSTFQARNFGFQGYRPCAYTCVESNRWLENRFHVPWLLQRSRDGKRIKN